MEQMFTFDKLDGTWWLRISNRLDLIHYESCIRIHLYEKACANILEDSACGNPRYMSHAKYNKAESISNLARMYAERKNGRKSSQAEIISEIPGIVKDFHDTVLTHVNSGQTVLVNHVGGYHVKTENTAVEETVESTDFPV